MKILAAAALLALSTLADAAPLSPDPTGLWWVPQESGWGLSLTQQGERVAAVLFVYDDAQRPTWYFAPMGDTGVRFDPNVGPIFAGPLYRTSGPWFGGAFDPRSVTETPVGTMSLYQLNRNIALTTPSTASRFRRASSRRPSRATSPSSRAATPAVAWADRQPRRLPELPAGRLPALDQHCDHAVEHRRDRERLQCGRVRPVLGMRV